MSASYRHVTELCVHNEAKTLSFEFYFPFVPRMYIKVAHYSEVL
jgi:hypothetical protein